MANKETGNIELYQQTIIEHNRNPRNFRKLEGATHAAEGYNPLCGDHWWVYVKINSSGIIEDAAFEGSGCAISKASASMMTASLKGKSIKEAQFLSCNFYKLAYPDFSRSARPDPLSSRENRPL